MVEPADRANLMVDVFYSGTVYSVATLPDAPFRSVIVAALRQAGANDEDAWKHWGLKVLLSSGDRRSLDPDRLVSTIVDGDPGARFYLRPRIQGVLPIEEPSDQEIRGVHHG